MIFVYLLLATFAYRGLLRTSQQADLSRELEEWFFIPTETSPVIVVLLAAWLVYRRRESLEGFTGQPAAWARAVPLLLASVAVFVWSLKTATSHLLAFSLLLGGLGLSGVQLGRQGMRALGFPALLLVFAIPLPAPILSDVLFRFQIWTAEASGWLLFMMGFPAYVSGDQVLLAADHFQVIEGCSGMRSVQTLTMVSVLLAELFGRRGWHAACLVALAPFVAFGLNALRVLALILNPRSDVVAIHNLQGVVILLLGLAFLYGVDGFLQRYERPVEDAPEAVATSPAEVSWLRGGLTLGFLGLLAALSIGLTPWEFEPLDEAAAEPPPLEIDGWTLVSAEPDFSFLGTIGFRRLLDWHFDSGSGAVELFALVGDGEDLERTPMSPKTVPPGSGWLVEERGPLAREGVYRPQWLVVRSGSRRMLVHHWYEGTRGLLDESLRGLLALDRSPWRRSANIVALRLATDVRGASRTALGAAAKRLERLERAARPALDQLQPAASRKPSS